MRQQVKEGVAAEGAHGQRHQEGEQELEAGLIEDGHQDHPQQRQQADDGDGHKAPHPGPHWRQKSTKLISTHSPSPSPLTRATCALSPHGGKSTRRLFNPPNLVMTRSKKLSNDTLSRIPLHDLFCARSTPSIGSRQAERRDIKATLIL